MITWLTYRDWVSKEEIFSSSFLSTADLMVCDFWSFPLLSIVPKHPYIFNRHLWLWFRFYEPLNKWTINIIHVADWMTLFLKSDFKFSISSVRVSADGIPQGRVSAASTMALLFLEEMSTHPLTPLSSNRKLPPKTLTFLAFKNWTLQAAGIGDITCCIPSTVQILL